MKPTRSLSVEVSLQQHQTAFPLEPVRPEQWEACACLLTEVFGGAQELWLERLAHWERNPAFTPTMARGWTARDQTGRIVAFMANAPFNYLADGGTRYVGMAAHTLAVRPEVRGQGIGRSLTNAEFREPCDFSVGVQTNAGGWTATLGGGGEVLGQQWVRKPRVVIAHPGAFLRRLFNWRRPPLPQPTEAGYLRLNGAEVEVVAAFVTEDDTELGRMVARPARIRPLRDAIRLNWLYFGTPQLRATRLVLGIRRHGRLVGYAGFRVLPDSLFLLECRRLPDEPEVVRTLLLAARHLARTRRLSHLLAFAYSPEIDRALPRSAIGAIWRRRFPYAIAIKNSAISEADLELGPWDGDAVFADDSHLFA